MQDVVTDVTIIGGGIAGLTTAYFLAQKGLSITVIEKDSIGSHASGFAYGGLSPLGEAGDAESILPLFEVAKLGMTLHTQLSSELYDATGIDTHHRFRPALDISFTEDESSELKNQIIWRNIDGYSVEWLDKKSALEIVPNLSEEVIGGLYTQGVADLEPYRFMLSLTQACENIGVNIKHGEITNLKFQNSKIEAVITKDAIIPCQNVVLAMGPWMQHVSQWINRRIPITPLKGQILKLDSKEVELRCSVGWNGNYACTKPDGLIWAGTTEEKSGFDDSTNIEGRNTIISSLTKMVSGLENAALIQHTACLRPLPEDGKIIIGPIPEKEGLFIATGAGRKGILLGPAMGKLTADLILGTTSDVDISPFSLNRFN